MVPLAFMVSLEVSLSEITLIAHGGLTHTGVLSWGFSVQSSWLMVEINHQDLVTFGLMTGSTPGDPPIPQTEVPVLSHVGLWEVKKKKWVYLGHYFRKEIGFWITGL